MINITDAIEQLKAYQGPDALMLHAGADDALIDKLERVYRTTLPDDFKTLYRFTNGFETEEDLFNLIPLEEIISNREKDHDALYIAEYMTYSDMWELKINRDDPNDYTIRYGELVLTKSLAEFIIRFLKGGVFENYGLYFWRDEIKAKINGPTKPENLRELLGVYYLGLVQGIISIKEVKDWADHIILTEDEPDYFFIELSLAQDTNELVSIINNKWPITDNVIVLRVLFGVLHYHLRYLKDIEPQKAIQTLYNLNNSKVLTREELHSIYYLQDAFEYKPDESQEELLDFLERYSYLNLQNYTYWPAYNTVIEEKVAQAETADPIPYDANWPIHNQTNSAVKFVKTIGVVMILSSILLCLIWIVFSNASSETDTHLLFMVPLFLVIPFVNFARVIIRRIYNK